MYQVRASHAADIDIHSLLIMKMDNDICMLLTLKHNAYNKKNNVPSETQHVVDTIYCLK